MPQHLSAWRVLVRTSFLTLFVISSGRFLGAQQVDNSPVTAAARQMLSSREKNLIAAAEAMPETKYSFRPTPQQISFAHLVGHIATSNDFLCSKLAGETAPQAQANEQDNKAKLLTALKNSFNYCSGVLSKLSDSRLADPVELFGGMKGTKATALLFLTSDWADHYAGAAMYLRLNGVMPPTEKQKE